MPPRELDDCVHSEAQAAESSRILQASVIPWARTKTKQNIHFLQGQEALGLRNVFLIELIRHARAKGSVGSAAKKWASANTIRTAQRERERDVTLLSPDRGGSPKKKKKVLEFVSSRRD